MHADRFEVPPTEEGLETSNCYMMLRQRNRKCSSPQVNGWANILRVKLCSHYWEAYEIVSRYWISMVVRCSPHLLSTRDINTEVPSMFYKHSLSPLHLRRLKSQHHEKSSPLSSLHTPRHRPVPRGWWISLYSLHALKSTL